MTLTEKMNDIFARLRTAPDFSIDEVQDFQVVSRTNQTLVQEAIVRRKEFVDALIEGGVPLDHQDDNGQTALQYAIARSESAIAHRLLAMGANPNITDKYGNNALWTAVMNPRPDTNLAKTLFEYGVDPHHRNNAGRSAADMVITKDDIDLKNALKIRG